MTDIKNVTLTWDRLEIIGRGSFGCVHRERCSANGKVRAVKEILTGPADNIRREIRCMIRVREYSSLVVGFQCSWELNSTTFIAMDYYPYYDLNRYITAHGPVPEPVARGIAEQLLQAVFVLHEYSIVHRDIKPENILIASYSPLSIRLADFGLAKDITEPESVPEPKSVPEPESVPDPPCDTPELSPNGTTDDTPDDTPNSTPNVTPNGTTHSANGTPNWAAPEQIDGDGRYDMKVDLWSVGCVVYYLLTSLNPFSDRDDDQDPDTIAQYQYPFWPRVSRARFRNLTERSPGNFVLVRGISELANEFLIALIKLDPRTRLSAKEALKHRWINPAGITIMEMALRSGNQALMNRLDSSKKPESDCDKLRLAAPGGHLAFVEHVLKRHRAGWLLDDGGAADGQTEAALVGAAAGGHDQVVAVLLARVKYPDGRKWTDIACQRAFEGGHTRVVNQLWPLVLADGFASTTGYAVGLMGAVGLMAAVAAFGTKTMLQQIISHLDCQAVSVRRPCFAAMVGAAARNGHVDNLTTLLSSHSDLEYCLSALLEATTSGHLLVVKFLLNGSAVDPTQPGTPAFSHALAAAAAYGHLDILKYLLGCGVVLTPAAIAAAAAHGHLHILKYLFARGVVSPPAVIAAAASTNHTACFQFLLHTLRETNKCTYSEIFRYITPSMIPHCTLGLLKHHLHPAVLQQHVGDVARLGRVDVVIWLLGAGASVTDALGAAAEAGQMDVLEEVLSVWKPTQGDIAGALLRANQLGVVVRLQMELECGLYRRG